MLPDHLQLGLRLVLVGTAVGEQSAARGHYYAGRGNMFWAFLEDAGLTPTLLNPIEDVQLLRHGIGLTDLVKSMAQSHDRGLPYDFPAFNSKIELYRPRLVAFTSKPQMTSLAAPGDHVRHKAIR
jgi:TDG/mug DNA glycosylase family protein